MSVATGREPIVWIQTIVADHETAAFETRTVKRFKGGELRCHEETKRDRWDRDR